MKLKNRLKNLFTRDLSTRQERKIPAWVVPLAVFILIAVFVIFLAPRLFRPAAPEDYVEPEGGTIFNEGHAVVIVPQAALYPEPDHRKERVASALYNEPVQVLSEGNGIYWEVALPDGSHGYMKAEELSRDMEPIEPYRAYYKAMVLGRSKRVYTHARSGELMLEVPTGTIFYCDYQGADLLRVKLPNEQRGWVSTDQLWVLPATEPFEVPEADARTRFLSSMMAFFGAQRLPQQMTVNGADMAGAITVAAKLNGVDLPRQLDAQAQLGERVVLSVDPETELPRLDNLQPGDLIYFVAADDPATITDAACVMEGNIVLMNQVNSSTLSLWDLEADEDRRRRIGFVRRHFATERAAAPAATTTQEE